MSEVRTLSLVLVVLGGYYLTGYVLRRWYVLSVSFHQSHVCLALSAWS
jgi:hypothetical protein